MRDPSTPPSLTCAKAAVIAIALAAGSPVSHAESWPDVAALDVAAEQDLAVVSVTYNGVPRDGLAYIIRAGDSLLIDAETLRRLQIRYDSSIALEREGRLMVAAAAIAGLSWSFDDRHQQLSLKSDPRELAMSEITYQLTQTPPPVLPHWGAYLNYGIFATSSLNGDADPGFTDTIGAGLTASLFGPYGVGTAGFLVNSRSTTQAPQSITVTDVNWRWDNISARTTLLVGDTVSTPGWWGRAVRFGGVQFGSNYGLQPGFVTYPLMAVSGLASIPSTADILINNVRVAEQSVPAGPFTISNLPTMTGAGELNMVVTDPFGQQRVISQPFYVAQQLLSPGLTEFSIGAGAGRLDYGIENFNYGRNLAYAWARHGINENLTGELRGEVNDEGAAVGAGADILVGNLGVLSIGAAATSGQLGNGTRYLVGFDRQTQFLSVGGRVSRATNNYREIGDLGPHLAQGSNAYVRYSFGRYGSASVVYAGQRYHDAESLSICSATYSFNIGARAYMTLTASKYAGVQNQTQAFALLTFPLDDLTSTTASVQTLRQNSEAHRIGEAYVQRSLPVGEGYGYYLRANTEEVVAGGVQYAGPYGRYTVEAATDHGRAAMRASATGGIAWVGDTMLFAQPIEQSFVVVRVGDLDGVRILQANQDVGRTQDGKLALAQVPSLNGVTIAIDPLTVPINVTLQNTTQQVVTLPRTGLIVDFAATRERNALVRLALPSGEPVPLGAVVQIDGRAERFPVGHDGEAYVTRLEERQFLTITFNGTRCRVALILEPNGPGIADIGPLRCELVQGVDSSGGTR